MWKNRSLKQILLVFVLLCTILPLAIISVVNFKYQYHTIKNNFCDFMSKSLVGLSGDITDFTNNNKEIIEFISNDYNFKNIVDTKRERFLQDGLENVAKSHEHVCAAYIGEVNGKHHTTAAVQGNYDPRERVWYKTAMEDAQNISITQPYEDEIG